MSKQNKKPNPAEGIFGKRPPKVSSRPPAVIKLSDLSEDSQEVVEHFGIECPNLLNKYCCALEDALILAATRIKALKEENAELKSKQNE